MKNEPKGIVSLSKKPTHHIGVELWGCNSREQGANWIFHVHTNCHR
jgi:hypothetical protein